MKYLAISNKLVFNNGKQNGAITVLKMVSISIQRWLTGTIRKDEKRELTRHLGSRALTTKDNSKEDQVVSMKNWTNNLEDCNVQVDGAWKIE